MADFGAHPYKRSSELAGGLCNSHRAMQQQRRRALGPCFSRMYPFRVSPGSSCSARGAPTLDETQRVASRPTSSSNPALDGYWEIELLAAAAASAGEGKTLLRAIRPSRTSITP